MGLMRENIMTACVEHECSEAFQDVLKDFIDNLECRFSDINDELDTPSIDELVANAPTARTIAATAADELY